MTFSAFQANGGHRQRRPGGPHVGVSKWASNKRLITAAAGQIQISFHLRLIGSERSEMERKPDGKLPQAGGGWPRLR